MTLRPGTYAPRDDVGPDESPYRPLPILDTCAHCRRPIHPMAAMIAVNPADGTVHRPLCDLCACTVTGHRAGTHSTRIRP